MSSRSRVLASLAVIAAAAMAPPTAGALSAQPAEGPGVVGTKIADGQAYATVVVLEHQPNSADNGRMLLAFEANGWDGIPIWESRDQGESWQFVGNATDPVADSPRCQLHWQPHLTEMPRTQHGIRAGTVLLSASTVCQEQPEGAPRMHLRLFTSADFGHSWDYVSTYLEGTRENPVWEPHLVILDDGTFVEFLSAETYKEEGYNQMLGHKVSADGGKTWGPMIFDTAMEGGVERPGMVIITRLPNGEYVYSYEDVAGPVPSQVYVKFSDDGLDWGDPEDRGTPVETMSGQYPTNTPNVFWFPIGGPKGVLVVTSRSSRGPAEDDAGNSLFWNNNYGKGPWWQAPTPVQKIGNNRAGWTQAMILRSDGELLHITSSGTPGPASQSSRNNQILYNSAAVNFNRYEAENAAQQGSYIMRDPSMSNSAKSRLGAKDVGELTFEIYVPTAGAYDLAVNFSDIGFDATPRLFVNRRAMAGSVAPAPVDPESAALRRTDLGTRGTGEHQLLKTTVQLDAGENIIDIRGGEYALEIDYLELMPPRR